MQDRVESWAPRSEYWRPLWCGKIAVCQYLEVRAECWSICGKGMDKNPGRSTSGSTGEGGLPAIPQS